MNETTALLVIDMQSCAFDGKIISPIYDGENLLGKIGDLIAAARRKGEAVIFVQHCALVPGQPYARDAHGWEIHPSIAPIPGETVVHKSQSSAFVDTELQCVLEAKGISTLIVCGIQSEHCVTNTSVSAMDLGLNVLVVANAHGTVPTDDVEAQTIVDRQNQYLSDRGAGLRTTAEIVALLAS